MKDPQLTSRLDAAVARLEGLEAIDRAERAGRRYWLAVGALWAVVAGLVAVYGVGL